ncbi:MFS transporter [Arthrobacter sp. GCM10027362]|uniref:MFS transporter n=1 Tax=Arthrobacter sp. GCM10027362 TaxID=3273379 RepID=UPI003645C4FE
MKRTAQPCRSPSTSCPPSAARSPRCARAAAFPPPAPPAPPLEPPQIPELLAAWHIGPNGRFTETWGRRPLIIWCFALMAIPLFILGFVPSAPVGVMVACFCAYALFSGGPSILEWAYPSELFPTNVRASAVGITTAASRIGAALGTFGLPFAQDAWGIGPTMVLAGVVTAAGFLLCLLMAEETRGVTLAHAGGEKEALPEPAPAREVV